MSIHEVPGPLPIRPLKKGAQALSRVLMGKMWSHEAEIMRLAGRRERRARSGLRAQREHHLACAEDTGQGFLLQEAWIWLQL